MKWTIGMPSYKNFTEVFFTVQSLRLYHNLKDVEIVIVDNYGDDCLYKWVKNNGGKVVRYERYTEPRGVSPAKNHIFDIAKGENIMVIDSHILVCIGALDIDLQSDDLYQGPLIFSSCDRYALEWLPVWRNKMWGIWAHAVKELPAEPKKIWAMGAGFFACKRKSWLKFNPDFRGFGGESGYIQEKYRKAGREVWCHPKLAWMHLFHNEGSPIPYPLKMEERINNYIIGFKELGLDVNEVYTHFGIKKDSL